MLYVIGIWKFVKNEITYWVIVSTNSSGSNHVLNMLNEHENLDQYVQYNLRECYVSFNFIGGDKEVPISVHLKANFHH